MSASLVHLERIAPEPVPAAAEWASVIPEARRRRLRVWFWSIAAATLAVVVIGGATRLTQSGLSIVDWDPIVGAVPPLNEPQWRDAFQRYQQFPEYQRLRGGMTLSEFKAIFFWEYLHRLAARAIGLVFLLPFIWFSARGYLTPPLARRAVLLFGLGSLQGAIGWFMVKSGLVDQPSVSHYRLALHLGVALIILGTAVALARELAPRPHYAVNSDVRRLLGRVLRGSGALLALQIVWGAFVAGLDAGFFYNTFPLMARQLLPPAGLAFEPAWTNLVRNPATVQWVHRLLGTLLLGWTLAGYGQIRRAAVDPPTARFNRVFAAAVTGQYGLGIVTLLFRVPVPLGVLHQAVAAGLVCVWVIWWQHTRRIDVTG